MNRTELTWLGFTREELVGTKKFADIISARGYGEYKRAIESFSAGQDVAEIETELVRKDGSLFDAFLRIGVVRDSQKTFFHTRATVIDITARKRADTEARIHAGRMRAISLRVVEIQETERRNLAAELHDRFGQDLAAINVNLHIIRDQLSTESRAKVGPRLDDSIALLEAQDGMEVVAHAQDGREAVRKITEHIFRALQAGAKGYLLKESAGAELVAAVRSVHGGRRYLSQKITETVVDGYIRDDQPSAPLGKLSGRERQILQLVAAGKSTADIARSLSLASSTVDTYRSRLMKKLDIDSIAGLVKFAIACGLTPP